jgi:hypothetical protein
MGPDTTFFSYVRTDSEFVLKLAMDLRQAGADIWLDQIDIKAGSRWDLSIETALKNSSKLVVILSPDSVASNNVMDEVSFALEEGKTVIPVLFKPCDIPFRLRRLQYADFTKNYHEALKNLLLEFKLGKNISGIHDKDDSRAKIEKGQNSGKAENIKEIEEEKLKAKTEAGRQKERKIVYTKTEADRNEKERKLKVPAEHIKYDYGSKKIKETPGSIKNKYKKPVMIGGIILVLMIIIGIVISRSIDNGNLKDTSELSGNQIENPAEMQAWNNALLINSIDGFKTYQANYPDGSHFSHAKNRIDSIVAINNYDDKDYSKADIQITAPQEVKKPAVNYERPIAKTEVKQAQSHVETQKPAEYKTQQPAENEIQKPLEPEIKNAVAIAEKSIDLTGRWLTDEQQEWKLVQTGDSLEITWYNRKREPIQVKTIITGNYFHFLKERTGNNIEGTFNIIDEKTLYGRIGANRLTITRIP